MSFRFISLRVRCYILGVKLRFLRRKILHRLSRRRPVESPILFL